MKFGWLGVGLILGLGGCDDGGSSGPDGVTSDGSFVVGDGSMGDGSVGDSAPEDTPDAAVVIGLLDHDFSDVLPEGSTGADGVLVDEDDIYLLRGSTVIERLSAAGVPDPTFDFEDSGQRGSLFLDGQGRLVELFEQRPVDAWGYVRHTSSGALDATFVVDGGGNRVQLEIPVNHGKDVRVIGMVDEPSGSVIVVGSIFSRDPRVEHMIWAARMRDDGTLDPNFGSEAGYALISATEDRPLDAKGVALDPDGRIIISAQGFASRPTVVMLDAQGAPVAEFGEAGVLTTDLGTRGVGDLAVDTAGRILLATAVGGNPAVARFLPDGSLDGAFGVDGVQTVPTVRGYPREIAILDDGGVMMIGKEDGEPQDGIFYARFDAAGQPVVGLEDEAVHRWGTERSASYRDAAVDAAGRVLLVACVEYVNRSCERTTLVRLNH